MQYNSKSVQYQQLTLPGDLILRTETIRYLGVWLDSTLSFKTHVTKKCKVAMANFVKIRSICHLLTQEVSASLVLSLCVSHLDYCKLCTIWPPRSNNQPNAESAEYVCPLSIKKNQMGKCHGMPCHTTLVTNKAAHKIQTLCAYI